MNIYISSSWKNRDQVRALAVELRELGHEVYDFTDPRCRRTSEIPPELFTEQFDPEKHIYKEYLDRPEWRKAVMENQNHLESCGLVILLLPCGIDATADWSYAIGYGAGHSRFTGRGTKSIIIGHPKTGERDPVHLWADAMFETIEEALSFIYHEFIEETDHVRPILKNSTSDLNYKNAIPRLSDMELMVCLLREVRTTGHKMLMAEAKRRKIACRKCGCTEIDACEGGCYWVEPGLCSQCVEKDKLGG